MSERVPVTSSNEEQTDAMQLERYPDTVTDPIKAEIMAYAGKEQEEKIVDLSKQAAQRLIDISPKGFERVATRKIAGPISDGEKDILAINDDLNAIKEARKKADRIEGTTGAIYDRVKQVADAAKSGASFKEETNEEYEENEENERVRRGSYVLKTLRVEPTSGKSEK